MLALYVQSSGLAASKFLERVWFYCCLAKGSTGIKGPFLPSKGHLRSTFEPPLAAEHMHTQGKPVCMWSAVKVFLGGFKKFLCIFKQIEATSLVLKGNTSHTSLPGQYDYKLLFSFVTTARVFQTEHKRAPLPILCQASQDYSLPALHVRN